MKGYSKEKLLGMYARMYLIRKYEERIYYLFLEGSMPGTIHQSHGQEATAVGMLYDLSDRDYMTSTHRPAGHCLAKGVSLRSMMAEMYAKTSGCCGGYGGAMHTGDMSVGAVPAIAIVGGGVPLSAGIALSMKMQRRDNVCVAFMGDGATNEGAVHEAMNAASVWKLPLIFAVENNLYGASTHIGQTTNIKDLAERGAAYGIPAEIVDGNDVIAVNTAAAGAIARAQRRRRPHAAGAEDIPHRRDIPATTRGAIEPGRRRRSGPKGTPSDASGKGCSGRASAEKRRSPPLKSGRTATSTRRWNTPWANRRRCRRTV